MEEKAIIVSPIVMPAVTKEEAIRAFNAYQELAKAILTPEDVQNIAGKEFKKKSFWRKCQRFFNLSTQVISEVREENNGTITYKFTVRSTAPNGAYMDATGACSSNEKGLLKTEHNTRAIAETRAKNRAIADLVAFGEVSAEEVSAEEAPVSTKPKVETPKEKPAPVETLSDKVKSAFIDGIILTPNIDEIIPDAGINVIEALTQPVGATFDMWGILFQFASRKVNTSKGQSDITDYELSPRESTQIIKVSIFGLPPTGLVNGNVVMLKGVKSKLYKDNITYLAQAIEIIE